MHARAQLAVCMRAARWPGNTTLYEIQNSCMGPAARACCIVLVTQVHSRLSVPVPVGRYMHPSYVRTGTGPVRSWLWTTYVCSSYCAFSLVLVSAGSATFFYPQGGLAQPAHQVAQASRIPLGGLTQVAQAEFCWLLAAGYR